MQAHCLSHPSKIICLSPPSKFISLFHGLVWPCVWLVRVRKLQAHSLARSLPLPCPPSVFLSFMGLLVGVRKLLKWGLLSDRNSSSASTNLLWSEGSSQFYFSPCVAQFCYFVFVSTTCEIVSKWVSLYHLLFICHLNSFPLDLVLKMCFAYSRFFSSYVVTCFSMCFYGLGRLVLYLVLLNPS